MSTLRRAIGNGGVMMAAQGITWTSTLLLTAALGRRLGDAGFGDLYLAMSFGVIFSVLVQFGLDQQLVRAVARDRSLAGAYLANSLAIKGVLGLLAYGLIVGLAQALHYPSDVRRTIAVYAVILLFNGVSTSLTAVYQAAEFLFPAAMGDVLEKVFDAVVGVLVLTHGAGISTIAGVFVVGAAVNAAWKTAFLRRMPAMTLTIDPAVVRGLLLGALPFFLYWALGSVYYRVDAILLSKMTDAAVVGWYGAAYKLFDTLVFLPNIVSSAILYPILSRLSVSSHDDLRRALSKGLSVILIIGIPICTGMFVLAAPIIHLVYGQPEFVHAVPALRWLAVALLILYVNSILAAAVFSLNQERKMTVVAALATVVNFGLNWLLIPHFQHVAAAAVTAGTELFILGYLLSVMPRDLLSAGTAVVFAKSLGAATSMAAVLYVLRGQSIFLLVPAGGAVYVVVGLLLRVVPAEDVRVLRRALALRPAQPSPGSETA